MSFSNVGKIWTPDSFKDYLQTASKPSFAKSITLHHTASPSLTQRPKGFTAQHLINLRDFYRDTQGWSAGPHLFVDDDQIFGLTPLTEPGVHAVSFNRSSIGIEVLGDYDSEDPTSGRGLNCWLIAAQTTKLLLDWLGLPINEKTVLFHRDDPRTSKTCPGRKVTKDWVLGLIEDIHIFGTPVKDEPLQPLIPGVPQFRFINGKNYYPVSDTLKKLNPTLEFKLTTGDMDNGRRVIYLETDGKKDELEQAIFTDGTTYAPESELRAYLLG